MKSITIRLLYIFAVLASFPALTNAQLIPNHKITGFVADEKTQPMEYASVSLLKAADSSIAKGTLSTTGGLYIFEYIPAGAYFIKATAVGYNPTYSSVFTIGEQQPETQVPTIQFSPTNQALATVTISATKPLIERKTDRMVMNIENSILSAGNTALEILARAPGVTIDKDDNISLNGKGGISVMINDKLTYLSAAQLASLLRSTDGNTIKSIELMSNPSAKYDAAGNAGIINIKLKKNTQSGTNGSVTLGAGYGKHARENGTITLNHKEGRLNIFGTYSHSDIKNEFNLVQDRVVTDSAGGKTYFDQRSTAIRSSHNNSYRFGADLATGSQNTLGFLTNGYFNTSSSDGDSFTKIGNQPGITNAAQEQLSEKEGRYQNFSMNLNDNLKIDTLGQELSFDLDYSRFNNRDNDQYNTNFFTPAGSINAPLVSLHQQTPSVITIKAAKADYSLPLNKTIKLEAGLKYSDVKTDNNLQAQRLQNTTYINDTTLSNRFIYDEKIAAAYFNLIKTYRHFTIQAGLRAEHTSSDGDLVHNGGEIKRSYLNLFPSIFLNQKLDEKNEIGLSYSKRVDRPDYQDLNPFVYYLDQYSYSKGNPFLNPQYTNKFEFNYTYDHSLNIALGYSHTYNYLTNLPLTDPATKIAVYTTLNLRYQNFFNISINSPYTINKWWTGNVNAVGYYSAFRSDSLLGAHYHRGRFSQHVQAGQYFQLGKYYKAEVMVNYDSPFIYGTYQFAHTIYSDLGFSHSFAGKKANLKLSVNDIFNSNKTTMISNYQSNDIILHLKTESRITKLTFTYNLGQNLIRSRNHSAGVDDEKSRAGK
jgi:iron complex outermembrane receptor protein